MANRQRVVVAMSGGVDSSTAALLLHEQGYDVIGIGLKFPLLADACRGDRGCCGAAGMADARRVALQGGFPFYTLNYSEVFTRDVIDDFVRAYAEGKTPNPCVECNRAIKFGHLLNFARELGAEFLATGHYARVRLEPKSRRYLLLMAAEGAPDQSYFLYPLTQERLAHTMFPLGAMTKEQVRELARARNLPVAEKPGSQDICFLGDRDYRALLAERCPDAFREGPICDTQGNILGRHHGIAGFTIGQRRGLRLAAGAPLYVLRLSPADATVVVGPHAELMRDTIMVENVNWIMADPPFEKKITVRVRYRQAPQPATLHAAGDGVVQVRFDRPLAAPAPGQSAVFYDGDLVLGGGIIRDSS